MLYIELTRLPDEDELQFHKRLIYGKLIDGTLSDVDYSELSNFVYGQAYSSDVARRMMYGSKRTLQLIDELGKSGISASEMSSEIDMKIAEIQKERQKFFDQRREYKKLLINDARAEHIEDRLVEAAQHLNETIGTLYEDPRIETFGENEAVLVFADWHYGLTVSNIWNRYDTSICRDRIRSVVYSAIERLKNHSVSKLHVIVLGDLIHGAIHTSARVASEELVSDQIMQASEILAQSVIALSKYVDSVHVHITYGNHARTVQNKKDNLHRDNMERLVPWWLTWRCAGEKNIYVHPESDTEYIYFDVCGHGFCATHGDLDSVKTASKTVPAIFHRKMGKDIDYIILADKHHTEEIDEFGVYVMMSGCLCGSDDFANDHRLYSTPSQLMMIVNEECGVDAVYNLKCE